MTHTKGDSEGCGLALRPPLAALAAGVALKLAQIQTHVHKHRPKHRHTRGGKSDPWGLPRTATNGRVQRGIQQERPSPQGGEEEECRDGVGTAPTHAALLCHRGGEVAVSHIFWRRQR